MQSTKRTITMSDGRSYTVSSLHLLESEFEELGKILDSFPHGNPRWQKKFKAFEPSLYSKKLVKRALLAHDYYGNTMLGCAASSACVWACEKLIKMGANVNKYDIMEPKGFKATPLYWATTSLIMNKNKKRASFTIMKLLINNGARFDLPFHYPNSKQSLLERAYHYQKTSGYHYMLTLFTQAAMSSLFQEHELPNELYNKLAVLIDRKGIANLCLTTKGTASLLG